jgi:hypothetical protein
MFNKSKNYSMLADRQLLSMSKKDSKHLTRSTYSRQDQYYGSIDRISFGAPRECFNNVVGPSGYNYQPFKPKDPGPGQYGTGAHPYKQIGSVSKKYTMVSRKEFSYDRDKKHSKSNR